MWRDPHGLFVCDTSDPGHPALVVFITGPLARRWSALGTEGILRELTPRLVAALGAGSRHIHRVDAARLDRRSMERRWL